MSRHSIGLTGLTVAGLHVGLVLYVVACILFSGEPDWPMYWFIAIYLDAILAALWIGSFLLSAALRAPRVGTVLLSTAAGLAGGVRRLSSASKLALASAALIASVCLTVGARVSGTLDRLTNGPNFVYPLTIFGIAGSWLAGSAAVNLLRITATVRIYLGKPSIRW